MKNNALLLVSMLGLAVSSANASTINYFQDAGTAYQTPALSTFTTTGSMMAGMEAWVSFSDGSVKHTLWATTGADSGAATLNGFFSISEAGTTYNADAWTLQNLSSTLSIVGFTLLGAGGDTVFDRTFGNNVGTVDSALGKDFYISGNYNVSVTYGNIVNITGLAAVTDEYESLAINFEPGSYFGPHSRTTFTQDTDNAAVHGTITKVPDVVSTGMLFGLSLTALAALKRRLS